MGQLNDASDKVISRIRHESAVMTKRAAEALKKNTMQLTTLKSQFEEHVKEVDIAITKAFRVLVREEERLDLAKDIKAQQDKIEQLRSSVEELRASKKSLMDDLRCKIAALDIDNSCRRITPQVASDKTKKLQASASAP